MKKYSTSGSRRAGNRRTNLAREADRWSATTQRLAQQLWQRLRQTKPVKPPRRAEAVFGWCGDGTGPEYELLRASDGKWFFQVVHGRKRTAWKVSPAEGLLLLAHGCIPPEFWIETGTVGGA